MREEADGARVWPGEFWLDGREEMPRTGEVRYHPVSGIELKIADKSDRKLGDADDREYRVILGKLEGTQPVTLVDCFDSDSADRRIAVNYMLMGIELADLSTPIFSRLSWKSSAVTAWYKPSVNFKHHAGDINITHKKVQDHEANIDEDREVTVESGPSYSTGLLRDGTLNFRIDAVVSFYYRTARPWKYVYSDICALDLFFCLALGQRVGIPTVFLEFCNKKDEKPAKDDADNIALPTLVTFLYSQLSNQSAARNIPVPTFTIHDMREHVGEIFNEWIKLQPKISRIMSLYVAAIHGGNPVDAKFLLLARAVEALHRGTIGGNFLPDNEFELIKQAVRNALPEGLKNEAHKVLSDRIDFWNELGFPRRIKDLCRELPECRRTIFPHFKDDARLIANYRNSLVHVSLQQQLTDDVFRKMDYFVEFLRNLFELSLLRLIGMESAVIKDIVERNSRYQWLSRHRTALFERQD